MILKIMFIPKNRANMYIQDIKKTSKIETLERRNNSLQTQLNNFFWEGVWKVQTGNHNQIIEMVKQDNSEEEKIVLEGIPLTTKVHLDIEWWAEKIKLGWNVCKTLPSFLQLNFIENFDIDFSLWKTIWFKNLKIKTSSNKPLIIKDKILSLEETKEWLLKANVKQHWLSYTGGTTNNFFYRQTKEGVFEVHSLSLAKTKELLHESVAIEQKDEIFFEEEKILIKKQDWTLLLLTSKGLKYIIKSKLKNIESFATKVGEVQIYGDWKVHIFSYNGFILEEKENLSFWESKISCSKPINHKVFEYYMSIKDLINEYCLYERDIKNNIQNVLGWNKNFKEICSSVRGDAYLRGIYENFWYDGCLMLEQKQDKLEFFDGIFLSLDRLREESLFIQLTLDASKENDRVIYSLVKLSNKGYEKIWDMITLDMKWEVPYIAIINHKKTKIILFYSESGEINQSFVVEKNNLREIPVPTKIKKPMQYKGRAYFFSNPDQQLLSFNDQKMSWWVIDGDFWFKNQTSFYSNETEILEEHTLPYCNVAWDEKPSFEAFVWKSDDYSNFNNNYYLVNPKNFKAIKEYKNIELFQWTSYLGISSSTIYWIKYPICLLVQETRNSRTAWLFVNIKRKEDVANILWKRILN